MFKKLLIISILVFIILFIYQLSKNLHINSKFKLVKISDVLLSGGNNRFDYQSINYNLNRLYIAHLESNRIHIYDLGNKKIIKDLPLEGSPFGILAVSELNKVFVSIGTKNQAGVIDETNLRITKYIKTGDTPDGITYDKKLKEVFVSNENGGTVSVINAKTDELITDIEVGSSIGNTKYNDRTNIIYSVDGNGNNLVEINPETNKVTKKTALVNCIHPHGFYIDPETNIAFITCSRNNIILTYNLVTNKIISKDTVGDGPDVLAYDEKLHYLYVASESGIITIFKIQSGKTEKIYERFIASNAHSIAVDQTTHYIYMPLESINGKPVLRIMKPN